jgi:hypothetical protein
VAFFSFFLQAETCSDSPSIFYEKTHKRTHAHRAFFRKELEGEVLAPHRSAPLFFLLPYPQDPKHCTGRPDSLQQALKRRFFSIAGISPATVDETLFHALALFFFLLSCGLIPFFFDSSVLR